MPRLFLIDPSILDYQGHHFEYARRVLLAAHAAGYEPIMAVNRRCQVSDADIRTLAVYRFGFWFPASSPKGTSSMPGVRAPLALFWVTPFLRLLYSSFGLRLARWRRWRDELPNVAAGSRSVAWLLPAMLCAAVLSLGRSTLCAIGRRLPFGGYVWALCSRCWTGVRAGLSGIVRVFRHWFGRRGLIATSAWRRLKRRQFERDTRALLRRQPMCDGDVALLPVASIAELTALERLFRRHPRLLHGTWHIVFRHNLYAPDAAQTYDESTRPLRNALRRFAESMPAGRFHFYTDSHELTAQHNSLGAVQFRTLPVPVDVELTARRGDLDVQAPLCLAYVGDARSEKGFQHLPKLVADILAARDLQRSVRFVIQSNFSHGGGADVELAWNQLHALRDERVQLVDAPLSPDAYRRQLLGADVLLLPYDRASYFARSSGILAEGLAAGIPAVVPAGNWMARQLSAAHFEYHLSLRDAWPSRVALKAEAATLTHHSAAEFNFDVSAPSTCVLITFEQHSELAAQFVRVRAIQYDLEHREVRRASQVIGGGDGPASCLTAIHPCAARLRVECTNAYSAAPITLRALRFDALQAPRRLPRAAIGVVLNRPEGLTRAVREVLRHYDHYRATAKAFAPRWFELHCPERLVKELERTSSPASAAHQIPEPHFRRAATLNPRTPTTA